MFHFYSRDPDDFSKILPDNKKSHNKIYTKKLLFYPNKKKTVKKQIPGKLKKRR